jgi:hypothetical protein
MNDGLIGDLFVARRCLHFAIRARPRGCRVGQMGGKCFSTGGENLGSISEDHTLQI